MNVIDMRSLPRHERPQRRAQVVALRAAGHTYGDIALRTGVSLTGVFNICKRHRTLGPTGLQDAPNGPLAGAQRLLDLGQEAMVRRLILRHTPDQLALPAALWTSAVVAQLIAQRCQIHLHARTLRKYLVRWGYAARPRFQLTDEPQPAAFSQWLQDDYPGIVGRARAQAAEIHWGDESRLPDGDVRSRPAPDGIDLAEVPVDRPMATVLATVTNRGERRWMDFKLVPDADALIDFLTRLTQGRAHKLFLIHGSLRVHEGDALARWLAEHDDSIEVFCLPGHASSGAPTHLQPLPLAA